MTGAARLALLVAFLLAPAADAASAYAWVLNGDDSKEHVGNVEHAVESLLRLEVPSRNVFVASDPAELDSRIPKANVGPPDRQTLALQLDLLESRVREGDALVVYLTGHGLASLGPVATDTRLALRRGLQVRASWMLQELKTRVRTARIFLVTDACYGGGFVITLHDGTSRTFAGISPTDERHVTFCQPFARLFWSGLEALDGAGFERAAESAFQGCPTFRKWKRCMHGPNGCPTYSRLRTTRFRD